ncbi:MAG: ABC transporter substrate-binding protein [Thermomicrobiales bacterium]
MHTEIGQRGRLTRRRAMLSLAGFGAGILTAPRAARAQSTPAAAIWPVTITHAMGETTIPERPERIVAAGDFVDLDYLLTLGLEPVLYGFTNAWESGAMPWQGAAADIPTFDATADLDLEAIAAARPDLIVTMPMYVDDWYDTLNAIAPTVVIDWDDPWRDALRMLARVTGENERAEAEIARADELIAHAASQLTDAEGMPLMVGFQYGDSFYIWGAEGSGPKLFQDLGLEFVGGEDPVLTQASPEQVALLNPAELLLSVDSDPAAITLQEASPLFQALPAVKRGGYGVLSVQQSRAMADGASPLSLEWALPGFVELIQHLAAGEGKRLP